VIYDLFNDLSLGLIRRWVESGVFE